MSCGSASSKSVLPVMKAKIVDVECLSLVVHFMEAQSVAVKCMSLASGFTR
jgi:hypothetical protein